VSTTFSHIDGKTAVSIAENFLGQHYSILAIKDEVLEGQVWQVTVWVSAFGEHIKRLKIDAKSGRIVSVD
jgi:hypothetical protein